MKTGKNIGTFYDKNDFFGTPVPSFKMEGHQQVGTSIGFGCSVLVATLVVSYACLKGYICLMKANPLISTVQLTGAKDTTFRYALSGNDFAVAFRVRGASDKEHSLHDPEYVEWAPMMWATNE